MHKLLSDITQTIQTAEILLCSTSYIRPSLLSCQLRCCRLYSGLVASVVVYAFTWEIGVLFGERYNVCLHFRSTVISVLFVIVHMRLVWFVYMWMCVCVRLL